MHRIANPKGLAVVTRADERLLLVCSEGCIVVLRIDDQCELHMVRRLAAALERSRNRLLVVSESY